MGLQQLPTRSDSSVGRTKVDLAPPPDRTHYITASEYNALATAVVELGAAVGLEDGSTEGSLEERVADLESGGAGPDPSAATPAIDSPGGTVGVSADYARADHAHPPRTVVRTTATKPYQPVADDRGALVLLTASDPIVEVGSGWGFVAGDSVAFVSMTSGPITITPSGVQCSAAGTEEAASITSTGPYAPLVVTCTSEGNAIVYGAIDTVST